MRACAPCHSETVATELTASARFEIETRLAQLDTYLDPGNPNYVDPAALPPGEQARYEAAVFDLELVRADRAFGAHNPAYTRRLLTEAELFFGVPPWKRAEPVAAHAADAGREVVR
jgi:hypothetical protein